MELTATPPPRAVPAGRRLARVARAAALALVLAAAGPAPADLDGFRRAEPADFGGLDRVEAFRRAHEKLSAEYAFTDWKGIDWPALYGRVLPAVERAAAAGDAAAYYMALHDYVFAIDDAHLSLPRTAATGPVVDALVEAQSGGGFGLGLAALDDGRVVAAVVAPGSPAAAAGIRPGAEILAWGGRPVAQAIEAVDLGALAAAARVATDAHRRLEQVRLLTRAPAGTAVDVVVRDADGAGPRTARLVAAADRLAGLDLLDLAPLPTPEDEAEVVSARMVDGYGYVRLAALADLKDLARSPEFIWDRYAAALRRFAKAGARGLVLDIRGNHGGYDVLAEMICGTLYDAPAFYEATELYDARTGGFLPITVDDRTGERVAALMIEPQEERFRGPVVALVNPRTISSGEGIARCVAALPDGVTLGFEGTRGSFGLAGGEIRLPDGIVLHYPDGRAVDAEGRVMIDSRHGVGGVAPEVRVPRTVETMTAYGLGEDVELGAALDHLDRQAGR